MNRGDELARNMTIREMIAAEIASGFYSNERILGDLVASSRDAVNAADALLAELERTKDAD